MVQPPPSLLITTTSYLRIVTSLTHQCIRPMAFSTTTVVTEDLAMSSSATIAARWWSGKESLFPWIPKPGESMSPNIPSSRHRIDSNLVSNLLGGTTVKLLILLIFVLNAKSWPFVWHGKSPLVSLFHLTPFFINSSSADLLHFRSYRTRILGFSHSQLKSGTQPY
jgi:hypothetical protein